MFTLSQGRQPGRGLGRAHNREWLGQWGATILVGLALGSYTLLFPRLPRLWGVLSLLVVLTPFVVLWMGDLRRLLLLIIIFDIPMQLDGHLFYREEMAIWGALAGVNYSLTTLALGALYGLWLIDWLVQKPYRDPFPLLPQARLPSAQDRTAGVPTRKPLTPLLPLGLYVACVALSIVVAPDRQLAAFELVLLLQLFLLALYVVATVRTRGELLFLVRIILVALLLQSLIMIGLRVLGQSIVLGPIQARIDPDQRVGGTIGGPNTAAGYLALVLPVAFALLWAQVGAMTRWLAAATFALGVIALGLTLSRGGSISLLAALALLILLLWRRQGWPLLLLGVLGAVSSLVLYWGAGQLFAGRLLGADQGAAAGRVPLLWLALQIIRDHPLLGIGANNFAVVVVDYLTPDFSRDWLYIVHNKYLLIWAELGPVGIGAYLWFLLATLRLGWRTWQRSEPTSALLALGLTAGVVGHMIHMQVDLFNSRQLVQMLWLQAALITAASALVASPPGISDPKEARQRGTNTPL